MSIQVFPTGALPGLTWDIKKQPELRTIVQQSVAGYEVRTSLMSSPLWHFELGFEFLRGATAYQEIQTLQGFFLQMGGQATAFYYDDVTDNSVTNQSFGTGDGNTQAFQLVRTVGGFVEAIQNPHVLTAISVNGQYRAYTQLANGIISFNSAPPAGASITWTGTFYFLCRFEQDLSQFNQFLRNLWELKSLKFVSVKS